MRRLTLQALVSLLGVSSIVLFFVSLTAFTGWWFTRLLLQDRQERAEALAASLASQIVEGVLTSDNYQVFERLQRGIAVNPDIRYAYVMLRNGKFAVHTFPRGFPEDLARLRQANGVAPLRYRTGDDAILEVGVPLADDRLGYLFLGMSQHEVLWEQQRYLLVIGVVLVGLLVGTIWVAHWIGLTVGRPLRRLAITARSVPTGHLEPADIPVGGTAEVQELGEAFRDMVRDLRRLEEENQVAQTRMVSAERLAALGELAAGLAHEILNPLDGVLECVRQLEPQVKENHRAAKYVRLMQKGLDRIHQVMRQMLYFARGSSESLELTRWAVRALLEDVMLLLSPRAAKRSVDLTLRVPGELSVTVDRKLIEQALLNLLLNAIDAVESVERPVIQVTAVRDEANWVSIYVDDNGPGVPEDERGQIFTPFFTTKEPGKGTGLGLSISRQLVQQCGGRLDLAPSPAPLGGARFHVMLPAAPSTEFTR